MYDISKTYSEVPGIKKKNDGRFSNSGCQLGYYDITSTVIANINANVRDFFKD